LKKRLYHKQPFLFSEELLEGMIFNINTAHTIQKNVLSFGDEGTIKNMTVKAFAFSSLALIVMSSTSLAGGFALREQSAYGQGKSFAGVAAGGSLSSMFWNPSTLSEVYGLQNETVLNFIVPDSDVDIINPGLADPGDIGLDAFVPAGYNAYRLNERWVVGLGTNGPFGLSTKIPLGNPARAFAGTSEVFSLNVNPSVAYDVNNWLSIGAGAQIQYFDVRLTNNSFDINGDDIGFGFTAGVTLKPAKGTTIGVGFRSAVEHELEGDLIGALAPLNFGGGATGPIGVDLTTPEMVSLGINQRITDAFTVSGTVEWTNWSRISSFPVINRNTGTAIDLNPLTPATTDPLTFAYEDGWFFSVGGEYDYSQALSLRAGVGYEISPIKTQDRSYRLPDDDRLWLSAGLTYEHNEKYALDMGYTFITTFDTDIPSPTVVVPAAGFNANVDATVHILAVGLKVKFGGHSKPADEIVRKY
jgi:long-chain fatty acid transport protein